MFASSISPSSYCKIQNQCFFRPTVYRKILFWPSGKLTWSLNCLYGRAIQLRTESEVVILQSPRCWMDWTLQTVLLMRTWFLFHHIVVTVVKGQRHRVLQMKSGIMIFLNLLPFEFYSDIVAFASIGQISMAVKELSFVMEVWCHPCPRCLNPGII